MKYLSDYTQETLSKHHEEMGSFYAFSQKQFDEQAVDGIDYVRINCGAIIPKSNVDAYIDGVDEIVTKAINLDFAENGKDNIITRELSNHECGISGHIEDVVDCLKKYGITRQEIQAIYSKTHFHM